ncbi:penicillin-binding protein 2B [Sinobaca qinghaiensis]|uniref:Penicillin-binding protein 2B n=1 Tax=Sinobaca qinghaiensis TaxID=342944 RepID=A0A419V641_9BACL|nr:penicillin-binding protein [Sinobaca qinghaiensis]RKD75453.1 penicillin-binding protein 2B [Sinobaca qinghaiensis]
MAARKKSTIMRALILLGIVSLFFMIFAARVVYVQVGKEVKGQDLEEMAESRWTTTQPLHGERGTIYDRGGEALAEEVQSFTAFAIIDEDYEDHIEDPAQAASDLSPLINMEEEELENLLSQEDRFQVELGSGAKYLSLSEKEAIEELDINGIQFITEPKRYYPNQTFASHVLGFTNRDMTESLMGLERGLNDNLEPEDGELSYERNRQGVPLLDPNEIIDEPEDGEDVYLTIDSNIQTVLEQAMTEVDETYSPNKITAVVANAKTGEILGMSNRPSFNPNEYESITNYTNFAVSDRIEPGSTMKMFTLAAAIEEGVYDGEETYQSGRYEILDSRISDHNNGEGWGEIDFDEGLQRSSNVAFAKLVLEKLGADTFFSYIDAFGFRDITGIDLPNETNSSIADSDDLDAGVSGFGQASAYTPIQLVQAATAIANDGEMMKPYVVDRIHNEQEDKNTYTAEPESAGNPISAETAKEVREKLETVVSGEYGTGKPYQIDGIDVAGKTGTAQISSDDGSGYLSGENENIFSFMGMAPADDPSIIVYVAVDRPELDGSESGSAPVSQIFNPVMKQSLSYMNIAPETDVENDEVFEETGIDTVNFTEMTTQQAQEKAESLGLVPVVVGAGNDIESQLPESGNNVIAGEKIFLRTNGEAIMPDMTGWSIRDAKRFSELLDKPLRFEGSGYVSEQNIDPEAAIPDKGAITITLMTPAEMREEEAAEEEPAEESEENASEDAEETQEDASDGETEEETPEEGEEIQDNEEESEAAEETVPEEAPLEEEPAETE